MSFCITVHCQWSPWTIDSCSRTCGGGHRTKHRVKIVSEQFGGSCSGQSSLIESCNTRNCPGIISHKHGQSQIFALFENIDYMWCCVTVGCKWSRWEVESCSKSCGGGQRTKIRRKMIGEHFLGTCPGQSFLAESCNTNHCPGIISRK